MQKRPFVTVLVLAAALGLAALRVYQIRTKMHCTPIPGAVAVCVNGTPAPWSTSVTHEHGGYYAPLTDLAGSLSATYTVSPNKKHVTVNGRELSKTNGVTNTREYGGKLYVPILDAANAAGYSVAADFIRATIVINK